MSETDKQNQDIARLKRENAGLNRRINELENEINRLRFDMGFEVGKDDISKLWYQEVKRASAMSSRGYLGYVASSVKGTSVWSFFRKGIRHFRRFRLLSFLFRMATKIAVFAESGVALVAWLSFSLFMLPFILVLAIVTFIIGIFRSRKTNGILLEKLRDKKVYVLFADRKQLPKNRDQESFLRKNAEDLARDGSVVVVVSPYYFSSRGLGEDRAYVTARREFEGVYIVRKNYFFMLRRRVIKTVAAEIVVIC